MHRQIRASDKLRRETRLRRKPEVADAKLPGKVTKHRLLRTVPQTDTGRRVENTKALERTWVKELGKIAP